mgnify:CR=1 FL=1
MDEPHGGGADVVVAKVPDYSALKHVLPKAIEALGGLDIGADERVVIKVNLCNARPPETGAITHPASLDALLWLLREHIGFEGDIYVVEGDSGVVLADQYVRWFGLWPVIKRWGAKWLNITKARKRRLVRINGGLFKALRLPEELLDAFFISLAKLKTNPITRFTGALKNQYGCLPYVHKMRFHPWIDQAIADINQALRPRLGIVDGIIAQVGIEGPAYGTPVRAGLLITGTDPVAVDAICARILGFRPITIGHLRECAKRGLGRLKGFKTAFLGFSGQDNPPRIPNLYDPLEALVFYIFLRFEPRLALKRRRRVI